MWGGMEGRYRSDPHEAPRRSLTYLERRPTISSNRAARAGEVMRGVSNRISMMGQIISHYRVLEKLGDGGMGVVWAADDTRLSRRVALKFLPVDLERDEVALARLKRKTQPAPPLNHPRICTIYDIDSDNGRHFFVMECL